MYLRWCAREARIGPFFIEWWCHSPNGRWGRRQHRLLAVHWRTRRERQVAQAYPQGIPLTVWQSLNLQSGSFVL